MVRPPESDFITVYIQGDEGEDPTPRRIFMSFGMLSRVAAHMGSVDQAPTIATDRDMQESVIKELMTIRDKRGDATSAPTSLEECGLSLADAERLLDWASGHVVNFFLRAVEKAQKRATETNQQLEKVQARIAAAKPSSSTTTESGSQA